MECLGQVFQQVRIVLVEDDSGTEGLFKGKRMAYGTGLREVAQSKGGTAISCTWSVNPQRSGRRGQQSKQGPSLQ